MPNGQFGTRIAGGKDSASPRYIYTCLNPIVKNIFKEDDLHVLNYLYDDGVAIEPEFYIPIIPMILVNGAVGIGTGYSTNIPSYSPKLIIDNLKKMLHGEEPDEMNPWYKGFIGALSKTDSKGTYKRLNTTKLEVSELPIQYWTEDFKNYLDSYIEKNPKTLKEYESHYTETKVKFILHFQNAAVLDDMLSSDGEIVKFEKEFKMATTRPFNTNNMHLFDANGIIKKYSGPIEIMKEFYGVRLEYYEKRKSKKIEMYLENLTLLDSRIKFILNVIEGKMKILNCKQTDIIEYLETNEFPRIDGKYDYLIRMPIYNLTYEKKEELLTEYNEKNVQYKSYVAMTIQDLWMQDLQDLENDIDKM